MCSIILYKISVKNNNLIGGYSKVLSKDDEKLLSLLQRDARASISDLARAMSVSRATVQNRMQKLQDSGVIKGYTLDLGEAYLANLVSAHVSIKVKQKLTARTNIELRQLPQISALYAISGEYDLIAIVQAQSTEQLSHLLDDIGNLEGVERTTSSVILETKFKRHSH
jgi:DNA-binding Lrp family transcriptional regulator